VTSPIAPRWANQDTYAESIESAADAAGVPREIAYGLIAQESGFVATAVRAEPSYVCNLTGTTGDASYGLTQLLYCTALGLGYGGDQTGLFDPSTNLSLGLSYVGQLISSHGGDVSAALSAYNGGDRPSLGYGTRLPSGQFANESYVDNVLNNAAYFASYLAARDAAATGTTMDSTTDAGTSDATDGSTSSGSTGAILGGAAAIALLATIVLRRLRNH